MKLTLLIIGDFPADEVARRLKSEQVETEALLLESVAGHQRRIEGLVVLIVREQGIAWLGEKVDTARGAIETSATLMLCSPPVVSPSDQRRLRELGATNFISPKSWSANDVAERIHGEVILGGLGVTNQCGRLYGGTLTMQRLYDDISAVAPLEDPALILGETGTGKELVAQELHDQSGRSGEALALNCAELRPELMGSELFGHAAGAFTDARHDRKGLLAEASERTVFLDEIGDLDRAAQAQLLRVIEERKFRPVGSNVWQPFRGRLVLATHRDLEADCTEGRFRFDLFNRIAGFTLLLPPLRERRADIPLLANHFIEECRQGKGYRNDLTFSSGSIDALFGYDWPGNVRELRGAIRKAAAYADGAGCIGAAFLLDLARSRKLKQTGFVVSYDPKSESLREFISRAQAHYLHSVLALTGNNKEEAARRAGLSRTQLYEKLKEIDLKSSDDKK